MPDDSKPSLSASTAIIVSAFVGSHSVAVADLPALFSAVSSALANANGPEPVAPKEPAANLRRLVTAGAIVCAECGARFRSIKRHLTAAHDLTPSAYLAKWGLKRSHPMVAPDYAAARSALAKSMGLGRKPATPPIKTKAVQGTASKRNAPAAMTAAKPRAARKEKRSPAP